MTRRFITLLLLFGALLQTFFPLWSRFGNLEMPMLTGLLVCIALHTDPAEALYSAALAGLLRDAFSLAPLGLSIPFFVGLALGVQRIRNEVFSDHWITYSVLGAIALVLETIYFAVVFSLIGLRPVSPGFLGMRLIGGLLMGAAVVPLVSLSVLRLRRVAFKRRPNRRRCI